MIDGKELQKPDRCYLPFFSKPRSMSQSSQWTFGAVFLDQYYTVFDMSPLDNSMDYIQIGLTRKRKNNQLSRGFVLELQESNYAVIIAWQFLIVVSIGVLSTIFMVGYLCYNMRTKRKLEEEKRVLCDILGKLDDSKVVEQIMSTHNNLSVSS